MPLCSNGSWETALEISQIYLSCNGIHCHLDLPCIKPNVHGLCALWHLHCLHSYEKRGYSSKTSINQSSNFLLAIL